MKVGMIGTLAVAALAVAGCGKKDDGAAATDAPKAAAKAETKAAPVDPNAVMVSSILQYLRKGRVKDDYFIQSGIGEVLEFEALKTAKITKNNLGKISVPDGIVIAGILRGYLFMLPQKDLIVQEKDRVFLFVEKGHVQDAEKLFSVGINFF